MSVRLRYLSVALFCLAVAVLAVPGASPATAAGLPYYILSDSYYHLDVPNGTMDVTVKATFQNAQSGDLAALPLFAMPTAANVAVTQDGASLQTKITPGSEANSTVTVVLATLPAPLKTNRKTDLVMTYSVAAHNGTLSTLQPGSVETLFLGQGEGSFVFVDVPTNGENYFDPGCVKLSHQPGEVVDAGDERWVCGDVTLIALSTDQPDVLKRCAALDDACRQRAVPTLFSAYVQSITDTSQRGSLEASVQMQEGAKTLTFKYFRRDEQWAQREFALAQQALPKLEETFGFPLPHDHVLMLQSHHIEFAGAAGVAFPEQGEVLIAPNTGFDDEVTVHELAHQWAGTNLEAPWLWEGLAEYGMRSVAPSLGITPIDRKWQSLGYTDNLMLWGDGSAVSNPNYWYGRAGAFWFAYQDAIGGPTNMKVVLSKTAPDSPRAPFDGKWFMDAGEAVSGANLDKLFLGWVFNPDTASATLADRRAAHDLVAALGIRAASVGLSGRPSDISGNLDAWAFSPVAAQVTEANAVLDAYAAVSKMATDAGLPPSLGVAQSWGTDTMAHTQGIVDDQRQAVQALVDAADQLQSEPADSPALKDLADARDKYSQGDFGAAKKLTASAVTMAYNEVAAGKMIELAKAKQAAYKPSFLGRIGLMFSDPSGDLTKAQASYASGDPASALKLSRSAYDSWNDASSRGLQRLAMLAGAMCALSFGVWFALKRLDRDPREAAKKRSKGASGHVLETPEHRQGGWKDWENTR